MPTPTTLTNKSFFSAMPVLSWALLIIAVFASVGCGENRHRIDVDKVNELIKSNPRAAIDSLQRIDTTGMYKDDKMRISLLTVKAKDKANITHTSDSAIKEVINYYADNHDKNLTPEALYYGGRVYYDLGDFPTSLGYFRQALEFLPKDTRNKDLLGNVLSQMGGTLNDLGLYSEAIPYIDQVIQLEENQKDTSNLILDRKMLGAIYLHMKETDRAKQQFNTSLTLAQTKLSRDTLELNTYLAATFYCDNDLDSALIYIRKTLKYTNVPSDNFILAHASKIYYKANILDSAYLYAQKLVESKYPLNKKIGYYIMLSPQLRDYVPKDSLDIFYTDYNNAMEEHFRNQDDNQILIQNAMYNYKLHDLAKQRAEKNEQKIKIWSMTLIIIVLILGIIILYFAYRHQKNLLELHEALVKIKMLEESMNSDNLTEITSGSSGIDSLDKTRLSSLQALNCDTNQLKQQLRNDVMAVCDNNNSLCTESFRNTDIYKQICSLISENKAITSDNPLWNELWNEIAAVSPLFKDRLLLLSDETLKEDDFHLAMLIKVGFQPAQIAILLSRTKGAITYRRKRLCLNVLGKEIKTTDIDKIISSL